jgi:hypothetical protein
MRITEIASELAGALLVQVTDGLKCDSWGLFCCQPIQGRRMEPFAEFSCADVNGA